MELLGKHWRRICWVILNTLSRMLPLPLRLQFGSGWPRSRNPSLQPMMPLLATGSPPRMILCPNGDLTLVPQWISSMVRAYAVRVILMLWTTLSLITCITLICWVSAESRQDLMKNSLVLSRKPSTQTPRLQLHLLEDVYCSQAIIVGVTLSLGGYHYNKTGVN